VQQGESPYARTTYRYTPFLAAFLAMLPSKESGRYLFCVADAVCGWIILVYRRQSRAKRLKPAASGDDATTTNLLTPRLQDAAWWLYNPLAINICTRGSAESLVVLLPVLCTVWIAASSQRKPQPSLIAAVAAGLCHGVAIHAKLYPVIYTLSFMTTFAVSTNTTRRTTSKPTISLLVRAFFETLLLWARRLLAPAPIVFGFTAVATFAGLTYAAVLLYGDVALHEGLLYHFSRVDHRHNYSMHWYWIYLARARVGNSMALAGRLLLVPQLVLLAYTSLGVAPYNLSLALFVQTFLFVAHNKVITAQYFTWYLCLLPLCSNQLRWTSRVQSSLLVLAASIVFWLGSAYCLEMQGMAVHTTVWVASLVFFMANVNVVGALLASSIPKKMPGKDSIKKKE
jgi:GPI mannosyltransferase 1 subunit M